MKFIPSVFVLIGLFTTASQGATTYGTLKIVGTPGAGQVDTIEKARLYRCEADASSARKKGSCVRQESGPFVAKLNTPVRLPTGLYQYNLGIFVTFTIEENRETVINLVKYSPPVGKSVRLFLDLTNESMAQNGLQGIWADSSINVVIKDVCSHLELQDLCRALRSNNPSDLRSNLVEFDTEAHLWHTKLNWSKEGVTREWGDGGRVYLNDGYHTFRAFFAVLPGVYGLEIRDRSGTTNSEYGIVVR